MLYQRALGVFVRKTNAMNKHKARHCKENVMKEDAIERIKKGKKRVDTLFFWCYYNLVVKCDREP